MQQLVYVNLSRQVRVAVDTVRRWVAALCDLHLCFLVGPWFRNVSRSLRKELKWNLRDWASIRDMRRWAEIFVACHHMKPVEGWNDMGFGAFCLGYPNTNEALGRKGSNWTSCITGSPPQPRVQDGHRQDYSLEVIGSSSQHHVQLSF